mmetsp:Transcript_41217/g.94805  ORF Transcript_41217/g.94805 Transcript_41217/m.94805 type:complete len:275 (+) Transcript_41217:71-895(+)|eukprot:3576283-Amphidinium_carterae.1
MRIVRYLVLLVLLRASACEFTEPLVEEVSLLQSSVETFRRSVADTDASCRVALDSVSEVGQGDDPFPTLGFVLRVLLRVAIVLPLLLRLRPDKSGKVHQSLEVIESAQQTPLRGQVDPVALLEAVQNGDHDQCQALLQNGAKPAVTDTWGCSALHIAASCNAVGIASLLIENGADIEALDAIDETPLHYAARRGCEAVAALLADSGANLTSQNMEGRTPLHLAGMSSHEGLCRFLLDKNATLGDIEDSELPETLIALLAERMVQASDFVQLGDD